MSRREQIENIVIGTLLNDNAEDNFFVSCKYCITPDMFKNPQNRALFCVIRDFRAKDDKQPTLEKLSEYTQNFGGLTQRMIDLSIDWHFLIKKIHYNNAQLYAYWFEGKRPCLTYVSFEDYVSRLVELSIKNE